MYHSNAQCSNSLNNISGTVVAQETYDMCATFQRRFDEQTLRLVTPGYLENEKYPNGSLCECNLYTTGESQSNSLNVTVEDMKIEDCSSFSTHFDTLTITAVYLFEL